ncbi:MAG: hypothetical protein ABL891_15835 [Burkholderiales bacterium]
MSKSCALHEDTFYEYFKPVRHPDAQHEIWGGHGLETFGKDLEIVRRYDPDYVWSVVDGESGSQWIIPGFHFVNRVCYLTTKRAHRFIPVEFRIRSDKRSSLTLLGLKRQLLKVGRLIAECHALAA